MRSYAVWFKDIHSSVSLPALFTALAFRSSKQVRLNSVYPSTCAAFPAAGSVCGFDLIVVSLRFGCAAFFLCLGRVCVSGCATDPGVPMCVLCSTPSRYTPPHPAPPFSWSIFEKKKAYMRVAARTSFHPATPPFSSPHPFTPDAPLLHGSLCFCAWNQIGGEKSGHLIHEAVGIDSFPVIFWVAV